MSGEVKMPLTIRRLLLEDMARAAFIHQRARESSLPPDQWELGMAEPDGDKSYYTQMVYTHNEVWGIIEQEVVAFIAFGLHEDDGYIEELHVLPEYQRRGFGTALITFAKSKRDVLEIWCSASPQATNEVIGFYLKCGFVHFKTMYNSPNFKCPTTEGYRWTSTAGMQPQV